MWASRSKWPKPPTPSTLTPTRSPLEPGSPSSRGRRGQGETNPLPLPLPRPLLYPLPTATRTPATQCPPGQKEWRGRGRNWAGGKGRTKEGNRTGQTALAENGRVQKEKKERENGKESWWLLEAPVRKIILQMHTPARSSQCWSRQTQHGLGVCIWMHLVNGTGNSLSPGPPTLE